MAIGTGLSAQFGMAAQVAYGTFVSPTRFLEFNSESIKHNVRKAYTRGLGDRFQRSSRVRTYVDGAQGSVEFDFMNQNMGLLLKALMGAVNTAGAGPDYTHTFTPDSDGLAGEFYSVQMGRPSTDGTIRPFNYIGGKLLQADFSCAYGANLKVGTNWDFHSVETSTAIAAVSIDADAVPLSFIDGTITFDATEIEVKAANWSVQNALNVERKFIGLTKREPIQNGEIMVSGSLEMEFEDMTYVNKYIAGTVGKLVLNFAYGDIGGSVPFELEVTLEEIEFTADTPTVGSSDVLALPLSWKALYDGTNPIIKFDYTTSNATP